MRHCDCLSLDEIASLPLREVVAKDAYLWLWVTGPFLAVGAHLDIMRAWGFEPTAIGFTWVKLNRNAPELFIQRRGDFVHGAGADDGRKNAGFVILGRRGRPERLGHGRARSDSRAGSRAFSQAPEAYSRMKRYCAGPRLECLRARNRAGWTSYGDEAAKFDPPKAAAVPDSVSPCRELESATADAEPAP